MSLWADPGKECRPESFSISCVSGVKLSEKSEYQQGSCSFWVMFADMGLLWGFHSLIVHKFANLGPDVSCYSNFFELKLFLLAKYLNCSNLVFLAWQFKCEWSHCFYSCITCSIFRNWSLRKFWSVNILLSWKWRKLLM